MNRMLHENLRSHADDWEYEGNCEFFISGYGGIELVGDAARKLADEIQRDYIPRPRYEDGTTLQVGDVIAGGVCHDISVYSDGQWYAMDDDDNPIQEGAVDVMVKGFDKPEYSQDLWSKFDEFKHRTGWRCLDTQEAVEAFVRYVAGARSKSQTDTKGA